MSAGLSASEDVFALRKGNAGNIARALQDTHDEVERCTVGGLEVTGVYAAGTADTAEVMAGVLQAMHKSGLARPTSTNEPNHDHLASIHVCSSESSQRELRQPPDLHVALWSTPACTTPLAATVVYLDHHHSFQACHSSYWMVRPTYWSAALTCAQIPGPPECLATRTPYHRYLQLCASLGMDLSALSLDPYQETLRQVLLPAAHDIFHTRCTLP